MKGAVHRLQLILHLVNGHGGIHVLAVKIEMTACLPQVKLCYMRSIKQFIIMFVMLIFPVILDKLTKQCPFGLPQYKAGTYLVVDSEKAQLLAKFSVVAFLCFFEVIKIF